MNAFSSRFLASDSVLLSILFLWCASGSFPPLRDHAGYFMVARCEATKAGFFLLRKWKVALFGKLLFLIFSVTFSNTTSSVSLDQPFW